jgi:uncharacterized membrane protein
LDVIFSAIDPLDGFKLMSFKLSFYVAMAAIIAFVVWAMMDAPSPSHPDSRVQQRAHQP